ncbi:MAG: endonuclease/exonuclease/phosphatase family protein [Gammaproteobacteria bacterium]
MSAANATPVKQIAQAPLAWIGLLVLALLLQSCATAELRTVPTVQSLHETKTYNRVANNTNDATLKVITLNIAHGRGDGFHQLLQNGDKAQSHLNAIATLLKGQHPDIVALQEADAPSFWSGKFDHVEYVAKHGSFAYFVHANHAEGIGISYGTAFVSNLELKHPEAITFNPELAALPKGFVVATVTWPGSSCMELDITSVHLDSSSEATRRRQAADLIATLRARDRPMVVMGDFNSRWEQEGSAVRLIASELGLSAYKPDQAGLETFTRLGWRLDWILISPEFTFHSYNVINDKVSDHRTVAAELTLNHEIAAGNPPDSCEFKQES